MQGTLSPERGACVPASPAWREVIQTQAELWDISSHKAHMCQQSRLSDYESSQKRMQWSCDFSDRASVQRCSNQHYLSCPWEMRLPWQSCRWLDRLGCSARSTLPGRLSSISTWPECGRHTAPPASLPPWDHWLYHPLCVTFPEWETLELYLVFF